LDKETHMHIRTCMHTQILACWHCNKKNNNSTCFLRCKEQNFTKVKLEIPLRQAEPLHSMYPVLELPLILRVCVCILILLSKSIVLWYIRLITTVMLK